MSMFLQHSLQIITVMLMLGHCVAENDLNNCKLDIIVIADKLAQIRHEQQTFFVMLLDYAYEATKTTNYHRSSVKVLK